MLYIKKKKNIKVRDKNKDTLHVLNQLLKFLSRLYVFIKSYKEAANLGGIQNLPRDPSFTKLDI